MGINKSAFVAGVCDKYDERLFEKRMSTEGNVCGCLLKNMELYDDCGLDVQDFITNSGRLLFVIVKKLREKGAQKFDETTFLSIVDGVFAEEVKEKIGDYAQIYNVMEAVNDKNWDAFLDDLNKSNALFKLYQKGFNIFNRITLENGNDVIPFEFFKNLQCQEVLEFYDSTIASMQTKVSNSKLIEEGYIEFDDAWLQSLKNREEMGVSFGEAGTDVDGNDIMTFPFLSSNMLGLKPGTLSAWAAQSGSGKSLANYSIIPTPNGPRKVGDIRPGDYLFGQNGKPTKVLMIHPQEEQKEIWKVHFKDGRVVECCKDHLWEYRVYNHGQYDYRVETTEQIYNRCNGKFKTNGFGYKYAVKLNKAVEYPEKEYSVDPYVMGALLGNAYFGSKALEFSSGTREIPDLLELSLNNIICKKTNSKNYNYDFRPVDNQGRRIKTQTLLKEYPDLLGARSNTQFIPKDYLYGSIEQRIALLQGLLDTDGTVDAKGRIRFSTTSTALKDGFVELCRSLGYVANVRTDNRTRYKSGICYNIGVLTPKEDKPKLFRLQSKKQKAYDYSLTKKRAEFNDHLAIVDIEKTTEKTDMTCFTVDAPDHLFLANDYIVTHNTTYMVTLCMSLAAKGEKIVVVTNESRKSELQALFLTWIIFRVLKYPHLSKRKLLSGEYNDEDIKIIRKAREYWDQHYKKAIKVVALSDADAQFSCQKIKMEVLKNGASAFIVDTMKMTLTEGTQDNSWIGLIKDVRSLTELAMKYNIIGVVTLQLAPGTMDRSWLDSSCLANCKQIKETLSNLVLFRKLYRPELDPESPFFIKPFRWKQNDLGEWYQEPYDAISKYPDATWIVAFADKTRRGVDSGMDGTAFLCRTDLDHASFFETARCCPTRKTFTVEDRR